MRRNVRLQPNPPNGNHVVSGLVLEFLRLPATGAEFTDYRIARRYQSVDLLKVEGSLRNVVIRKRPIRTKHFIAPIDSAYRGCSFSHAIRLYIPVAKNTHGLLRRRTSRVAHLRHGQGIPNPPPRSNPTLRNPSKSHRLWGRWVEFSTRFGLLTGNLKDSMEIGESSGLDSK